MCLAQGLSLHGRKVLVIDLDPQASLSELCGLYAEKEIFPEDTILPFIYDQRVEGGLLSKVQPTYWDGLDIIPAHTELVGAEYHLPAMQMKLPGFNFWTVLRERLAPLRKHYDYILLDTSPSLSYLNLNALMAADAMVMPMRWCWKIWTFSVRSPSEGFSPTWRNPLSVTRLTKSTTLSPSC